MNYSIYLSYFKFKELKQNDFNYAEPTIKIHIKAIELKQFQ